MDSFLETLLADMSNPDGYTTRLIAPLAAAAFGAFYGARLASKMATRKEMKSEHKDQLRTLLSGVSLSAQICNSGISLKRQHVKDICQTYCSARKTTLRELGIPTLHKTIRVDYELNTISPVRIPASDLSALVNREILEPEVQNHASALQYCVENVEHLLQARNRWILEFKGQDISNYQKLAKYFGVPDGASSIDTTYFDIIQGLRENTDDLIVHSYILHLRISRILIDSSEQYRKRHGRIPFSIPFFDFSAPEKKELLPDFSDYPEWLAHPEQLKKPSFWQRSKYYTDLRKRVELPNVTK